MPVQIKANAFSWNKATSVTLDEKNMDTEVIVSDSVPSVKDIYAGFLRDLRMEAAKLK